MTVSKDFIPRKDQDFDPWQINLVEVANTNKSSWGWSAAADTEWTLLTATAGQKKKRFDDVWDIVKSGEYTAADKLELKIARKSYKSGLPDNIEDTSIRIFINRHIRYNPLVTDKQKKQLGMHVKESGKATPAIPVEGQLTGKIVKSEHLYQKSKVEVTGKIGVGLEERVKEIQIFIILTTIDVKISPALKDYDFDGIIGRGLYPRSFDSADEGKRAWYYARKVFKGKNGNYGLPSDPWNEIII